MKEPMQDIQITLTIPEVNQVLDALGQRPYADVYRLVSKIQQQADQQLSESEGPPRGYREAREIQQRADPQLDEIDVPPGGDLAPPE